VRYTKGTQSNKEILFNTHLLLLLFEFYLIPVIVLSFVVMLIVALPTFISEYHYLFKVTIFLTDPSVSNMAIY